MPIALATGAYRRKAVGLPDKVAENCFIEKSGTLPDGQFQIVTRWGSLALPSWASNARGYKECYLGGVPRLVVVVGSAIKTFTPSTGSIGTITGSIAGTDRVVIEYTETEIGILGGGVFHVGNLSGVAAATDADFATLLSDHGQTAFINLMSIGQRFILQYGSRFCFTEVLDGDNITALSYYTAEYAPDGLVGGTTVGLKMWHMGQETGEPWEETGDADNPFRRSLGQELKVGLRARDTFKVVDGVPYWVDQNNEVRRQGNALIPETVSGPDISKELAATDPADMLGFALEFEGHAFYGLRLPTMCPLIDANYNEWTRFLTNETATWRYGFVIRISGSIYVGDAEGTGFALMAETYKSEHMPDPDTMGTEIVGRVSGYVLTKKTRRLKPLYWEGSKGIGLANGQGSDPVIMMRRSLNGAGQFSSWRSRSIGAQGVTDQRVEWNQMGKVTRPGCAIELQWSDPVAPVTLEIGEVDAA